VFIRVCSLAGIVRLQRRGTPFGFLHPPPSRRRSIRGEELHGAKHSAVEDDARLMERVRLRDAAAFEALYDRHHRLVYAVAMRMLGEVSAAEDILQTVFLKVWSAPETFVQGNFAAWIGRTTRNKCLDTLREKRRHPTDELVQDAVSGEAVDATAFAHLDAAGMQAALTQLSDEQRKLIELAYFTGMSHQRIADKTGMPLGTVKTRIRTGLQRLRRLLDGMETA
jgi:RNA polymerase sigma-70 factor (ECF subfamily)